MRVDEDVLNGVEPEIPHNDEVFPKVIYNPDFLDKAYLPIKEKITQFHPAYWYPHHRMYVYTNVDNLNLLYLRDDIILPVEKAHFFEKICEGCKGVFIIRYYTFNKNKLSDISTLFNILDYYYKTENPEDKLSVRIKQFMENAVAKSVGEISLRIIDFIDIEKFNDNNIVEVGYLNMVFAKYVDDLVNYKEHLKTGLRDKILEVDTTNKLVVTIEFNSNKVFDKKYLKILDEVVELRNTTPSVVPKPELWLELIEDGMLKKAKAYTEEDRIFCKLYSKKEDLLAEENVIKELAEITGKKVDFIKSKLEQAISIRKQLLSNKTEFLRILSAIEKNHNLHEDKTMKEFIEVVKALKLLL